MSNAGHSPRTGIALFLAATFLFAAQDAMSKILVADYDPEQVVFVRFAVLAVLATAFAANRVGIRGALFTTRPLLQVGRSLCLVIDIVLFAVSLKFLGLADIHATFTVSPLLVTALAPVILGERVGWRRWSAVIIGFAGALVIIRPGFGVFQPVVLLPLGAALGFALYNLLTRLASRDDHAATSLVYTGWVGALALMPFGLAAWTPPTAEAWILLAAVSLTGLVGHYLLILALGYVQAASLQPLNYLMVVWAIVLGYVVFSDLPDAATLAGAAVVIASGLFVMWRERGRVEPDAGR